MALIAGLSVVTEAAPVVCDPTIASVAYAPAQGEFAMLLFEDNWPENGDLDFNDQALSYNFALAQDVAGRTVAVQASLTLLARLAGLHNGIYLHLPVPASSAATIVMTTSDGQVVPLRSRAGESELVIPVSEDSLSLGDKPTTLLIRFSSPVELDVSKAPFDLFIARTGLYGHQIHLPSYGGTDGMDHTLFGQAQDGSTSTRHFVNRNGLPFAQSVPQFVRWPQETVAIDRVYPDIVAFAASGGTQHMDWYLTNVDSSLAVGGPQGAPPPSPMITEPDFSLAGDPTACGCPAGQTLCGGACVDIQINPANCGACGYACLNGRTCSTGRCTPAWIPASTVGAPTPRFRHAAAPVAGRVLITGGARTDNTGAMADTFFYDPAGDAWAPGPPLGRARCAHSSVGGSGKVFVFGGLTECSNGTTIGPGLEEFSPATGTWRTIAALGAPSPRYNHNAVWLPMSEMLVFGGGDAVFTNLASGGRYGAATGAWTDASCGVPGCATGWSGLFVLDANTAVSWGGSGRLAGAKLDLPSNTWSPWTPPSGAPPYPTGFAESADRWFVINGDGASECPASAVVHIYDKARGAWTADGPTAIPGLAVTYSSSNQTVWTGSELFLWSAQCDPRGVGWRYQPPAR